MDRNEIIEELRREIAEIKSRVALLEDKLAALENDKADPVEHIDLEQENILPDIAEIADVAMPVEAPVVEPAADEVEVKPVAEDIEDMPEETVISDEETTEEPGLRRLMICRRLTCRTMPVRIFLGTTAAHCSEASVRSSRHSRKPVQSRLSMMPILRVCIRPSANHIPAPGRG